MSRLCAKPTCSDLAERWFDVCAAECEVVERSEPTPSTIAFCRSHAARFSVPVGWAWIALHKVDVNAPSTQEYSQEVAVTSEANAGEPATGQHVESSDDSSDAPHRRHTRDAPWFLANAAPSDDASDGAVFAKTTKLSDSHGDSTLSAGSLLHRAFHGPDRDHDVARADADRDQGGRREERTQSQSTSDDDDVATVRDLNTKRTARSTTTSYDVELPFPPVDAEPHVAVS